MQLSKNACPMRGAFHAKKVSQRLFVGESLLNKPQLIILFSYKFLIEACQSTVQKNDIVLPPKCRKIQHIEHMNSV